MCKRHLLNCGVIERTPAEMNCEKLIRWYEYKVLPHCTECGPLEFGKSKCETCQKQKKKKKIGKLTKRKHLILQEKTIDEFWPIYCEDLKRFRMHRFKFLILGKRYQSDPRKESLRENQGEFALNHDFTECLSVKHNEEIQSSHFG